MAPKATQTAFGVTFEVALEQYLPPSQRIFDDKLAAQMLTPAMKTMAGVMGGIAPLRNWIFGLFEKQAPGIRDAILSRKRYIDDKLIEALGSGIEAVVILGAGLDTRAYRLPQLASLPVYEVDLPENIDYKRKRIEKLYGSVPAHVVLVPIDFETADLESVLKANGYSVDQKAFFIWEGVTQYLSEPAARQTLQFLAKVKPGSRLVFTYVLKEFIDGTALHGLDNFYQTVRVKSQLWRFGLDPRDVTAFLAPYAWTLLEDVGAAEHRQRYVNPAGRTELVSDVERIVLAEKSAR